MIRKCATRRRKLKCSHYCVAKRQQFLVSSMKPRPCRQTCKVVPVGWIYFPALRVSSFLSAVRASTSTTRTIFSSFFRFVQQETCIWYHTIFTVVFVVLGSTKLRPTAGAEVLIRQSTTLQMFRWLFPSAEDGSCAISSWPSNATSAVNIANSRGATAS